MCEGRRGEKLIFLVSQPRAGSSLLQRILGGHPQIQTVSEPWLLLHPVYAMRAAGYEAEYDAHLGRQALQGFLRTLPRGEEAYVEGLRKMCGHLYGRALAESGKSRFLDKTPRYYYILPELFRVFPQARFIILFRNPLAVLCSILGAWVKENWFALSWHKDDLLRAPHLLLEGLALLGERCVVARFEELVRNPEGELREICKGLRVDFEPAMIEYGRTPLPRWPFGDQETLYRYAHPVSQLAENWLGTLEEPQCWRLASDYLRWLGRATLERMGYPYEEVKQRLESRQPGPMARRGTLSLAWLLKKPEAARNSWEHALMRLARFFCRRRPYSTQTFHWLEHRSNCGEPNSPAR